MDILSSTSMGLAAVCFWQKEFHIDDLLPVTLLLAGAAWPGLVPVMAGALTLAAGLQREMNFASKLASAWLKNWRMWVLVSSLFVCHLCSVLTEIRHFSIIVWVAGCVQLLREPAQLKLWLREWRIALGPIYTMAATGSFFLHACTATTVAGASIAVLGVMVVVVASIALRPDNQELDAALLKWLPIEAPAWPRTFGSRAKCHGILMVLSMVLLTLLLVAKGEHFLACSFLGLLVMEGARRTPSSRSAAAMGSRGATVVLQNRSCQQGRTRSWFFWWLSIA